MEHPYENLEMVDLSPDYDIDKLKNKNRMLQRKLEKFQGIIKELMEEEELYNMDNNSGLDSSIIQQDYIIKKDNYGNIIKQVPSKLGDNYIVIDAKKDLSELDRDEYKAIVAQSDFSNYNRTSTYAGKFGRVYGWTSTGVKYGKYALALL